MDISTPESELERNRKSETDHELRFRARRLKESSRRLLSNRSFAVGLSLVLFLIVTAIFAEYITPYPEDATKSKYDFFQAFKPPSAEHIFGTDDAGRDVFTRCVFGTQTSLLIGAVVVAIVMMIGIPLGLLGGYLEGKIGTIIMRITDIFLALPALVLILCVVFVLGPNLLNAILTVSLVWWPAYCRLVYGEVLSLKEEQFIEASRAIGAGTFYITFKEILPNVTPIVLVKATMDFAWAVMLGLTLSFLSLGAQEPTPDWGLMIIRGYPYLPSNWWLVIFPGIFILMTVVGFGLLGDGLRDVLELERLGR